MIFRKYFFALMTFTLFTSCKNSSGDEEYSISSEYHRNLYWLMSNADDFYQKNKRFPKTFYELATPIPCSAFDVDTAYPHRGLNRIWSPEKCHYSYKMTSSDNFIAFCALDYLGNKIDYVDNKTNLHDFMKPKKHFEPPANRHC